MLTKKIIVGNKPPNRGTDEAVLNELQDVLNKLAKNIYITALTINDIVPKDEVIEKVEITII